MFVVQAENVEFSYVFGTGYRPPRCLCKCMCCSCCPCKDLPKLPKVNPTRKDKILGQRKEEVSAMINKEGEVADTRESVIDNLMDYNEKLLSRKDHHPDFEELFQLKRQLKDMVQNTKFISFDTFTMEEYLFVVRKVQAKNKNMFNP